MANAVILILMSLTAMFLIVLVLIQRGKGGGLAGAFGGMGGQSAFGAKAGDVFTRVTMVVATFWILLCIVSFSCISHREGNRVNVGGGAAQSETGEPGLDSVPEIDGGASSESDETR